MTDLIDYLRDRLEHADDLVCCCPDIDVSAFGEPPGTTTLKGYDQRCLIHGVNGTEPTYRAFVQPGMVAIGDLQVLLWLDGWRCRVCQATGPHDEANEGAWDHLRTHVPARRKRWWRRR